MKKLNKRLDKIMREMKEIENENTFGDNVDVPFFMNEHWQRLDKERRHLVYLKNKLGGVIDTILTIGIVVGVGAVLYCVLQLLLVG